MNIYESQVRKFYAQIWDNKNFQEVSNVLHDDFRFRGSLGQEKWGHEGFIDYVNMVHAGLSNYRCLIDDLVIEPGKVFAKMSFTGLHSADFMGYGATGRQVTWAGAALFQFDGDKIASLWVLGDVKNLERQLASASS